MHRTPEEWSKVKPSAVTEGSTAQATNALAMARDDILELAAALEKIAEIACGDVAYSWGLTHLKECGEIARKALREHDLMQPIHVR